MNFLLHYEAQLEFFLRYKSKMGEFRPINSNETFQSRITGNTESLSECLLMDDGKIEIFFFLGENDFLSWCVSVEHDKDKIDQILTEKLFLLKELTETVASVYRYNKKCYGCGKLCPLSCTIENYCSENCSKSIPCDHCGFHRLPYYFDIKDLSSDVPSLCCQFCRTGQNEEEFTIDFVGQVFQSLFPHIRKNYSCDVLCCTNCNKLFMHDRDKLSTNEEILCYPCWYKNKCLPNSGKQVVSI